MGKARENVEFFRRKSHEESAHLLVEIERLQNKRIELREELKSQLNTYLQQLDGFSNGRNSEPERDLMDLFQRIQLSDIGMLDVEDLKNFNPEPS